MPLPPQIDARTVQVHLSPAKDVEGMHPENMGRLFYGGGMVAPCTPMAAVELLRSIQPDLAGKETVVVGHSEIVGKPIAMILLQSLNASPTVTVCHVATKDLAVHTRRAEVLFVATGVSQARWLGYQRRKKAGEKPAAAEPRAADLGRHASRPARSSSTWPSTASRKPWTPTASRQGREGQGGNEDRRRRGFRGRQGSRRAPSRPFPAASAR